MVPVFFYRVDMGADTVVTLKTEVTTCYFEWSFLSRRSSCCTFTFTPPNMEEFSVRDSSESPYLTVTVSFSLVRPRDPGVVPPFPLGRFLGSRVDTIPSYVDRYGSFSTTITLLFQSPFRPSL